MFIGSFWFAAWTALFETTNKHAKKENLIKWKYLQIKKTTTTNDKIMAKVNNIKIGSTLKHAEQTLQK